MVVYPLSKHRAQNEGEWQLNTKLESQQDIEFAEAIIEDLSSQFCVDLSKVYATDYSLGLMVTYKIVCHLNHLFAAIASFSGTMSADPISCFMSKNISILHIHGELNNVISYYNKWVCKDWDSVGVMMDIPVLVNFW